MLIPDLEGAVKPLDEEKLSEEMMPEWNSQGPCNPYKLSASAELAIVGKFNRYHFMH